MIVMPRIVRKGVCGKLFPNEEERIELCVLICPYCKEKIETAIKTLEP